MPLPYYERVFAHEPSTTTTTSSTVPPSTVTRGLCDELDSLLVDMAEGRSSEQWRSSFNNKRMAFVHATTSPVSDYDSPYESTPPPSTTTQHRPVPDSPPMSRASTNGRVLAHRSAMSDFWRGVVMTDEMAGGPHNPGTDYSCRAYSTDHNMNRTYSTGTPDYSNRPYRSGKQSSGEAVLDQVSSLLQQTADMLDSPQGAIVAQDTAKTLLNMRNAHGWKGGGRAVPLTVPHYATSTVPHAASTVPQHSTVIPHHYKSLNVITEDTVYRTKPIIQVNLSIPSAKSSKLSSPLSPCSPYSQSSTRILTSPLADDIVKGMAGLQMVTSPLDSPPMETGDANVTLRRRPFKPGISPRRFYLHRGAPHLSSMGKRAIETKIVERFEQMPNGRADCSEMLALAKIVRLPGYTKCALMACCVEEGASYITRAQFLSWWHTCVSLSETAFVRHSSKDGDEAWRVIDVLTHGQRTYLMPVDLTPIIDDLIHTFPGLEFLKESSLFHGRYIQTVIVRIFFTVCRSPFDTISADELRRSNLIETLHRLDMPGESPPMSPYIAPSDEYAQAVPCIDINALTDFFAYEHFYVIYCKFWEIDTDHDLLVTAADLECYAHGSLTPMVVGRILSAACRRRASFVLNAEYLTYNEFVVLILADEDKTLVPSIEYWFRVLDLDGDGILSYYELESFYSAVCNRLLADKTEPMGFADVLCQMLDVIDYRPCDHASYSNESRLHDVERKCVGVRLSHLKRARHMAPNFLNTFVNVNKYLDQEVNESQNDRAKCENENGERVSPWDRFCREEYDVLMTADECAEDSYHELNMDGSSDED